jgi:hypothetical protein
MSSLKDQLQKYFDRLGIRVFCTGIDEVTAIKADGTRKTIKGPILNLFDELVAFAKSP